MLKRVLAILVVVWGVPAFSNAATIETEETDFDGERVTFIYVDGELQLGDERLFANAAINAESAIVFLSSPGGNLHAGIEIGKAIRLKGFATVVPEDFSCASACALAWLGGSPRLMAGGSTVGFHAASEDRNGQTSASSAGNAVVGAYLNQLGLRTEAVVYITEPQPTEIRWLTFDDAESIGLQVEEFRVSEIEEPETAGATRPIDESVEPPDLANRQDWTDHGEWIQIFSRTVLSEAASLAEQYRKRGLNTFVFHFENGWYGVVIGPYAPGTAKAERDRLLAAEGIPKDSYVSTGARFVRLTWSGRSLVEPWVAYGEWVQVASVRQLSDAIELGREYLKRFDNVFVFRHDSGLYAVVIGPYGTGSARPERDQLLASGKIPGDSFANVSARFVELSWRSPQKSRKEVEPEQFRVYGVSDDDVLNLRSGPGTNFSVVAEIPPSGTGISIRACKIIVGYRAHWCEASWQNHTGWASACCLVSEETGLPPAAGSLWQTYVNARFGTIADVPTDWLAGEPPENGDGLRFASPDRKAWIAIFGSWNLQDTVGKTMDMLDTPGAGEVITYRHRESRMIVVSGTRGDFIFYKKSILSCRDRIWNSIHLEYPSVRKVPYDKIVTHVARSLRGPGPKDVVLGSPC